MTSTRIFPTTVQNTSSQVLTDEAEEKKRDQQLSERVIACIKQADQAGALKHADFTAEQMYNFMMENKRNSTDIYHILSQLLYARLEMNREKRIQNQTPANLQASAYLEEWRQCNQHVDAMMRWKSIDSFQQAINFLEKMDSPANTTAPLSDAASSASQAQAAIFAPTPLTPKPRALVRENVIADLYSIFSQVKSRGQFFKDEVEEKKIDQELIARVIACIKQSAGDLRYSYKTAEHLCNTVQRERSSGSIYYALDALLIGKVGVLKIPSTGRSICIAEMTTQRNICAFNKVLTFLERRDRFGNQTIPPTHFFRTNTSLLLRYQPLDMVQGRRLR